MKKNKITFILGLCFALLFIGCEEGIDSITEVDPGPDSANPTVSIISPDGDVVIPFTDTQTDLPIEVRVEDDIEIANVTLSVNGSVFQTFDSFLDYRVFINSSEFENMPVGTHTIELTATDLVGNTVSDSITFEISNQYVPELESETLYIPFFEGIYTDLIIETDPQIFGNPSITPEGFSGSAYQGTEDAYLTFPTDGLLGEEFSATFWMNINATPDRAGILVIGPEDTANANYPDSQNNRISGFRFFRENAGGNQRFILNVGNGTGDSWFNGQGDAEIEPDTNEWVHFAFTISSTECVVYINGEIASQGGFSGVDWTGCDTLSIMSGAPRFTGWNHRSDASLLDELRLYNEALTQQQIQAMIPSE